MSLAIIGGTGLYALAGLDQVERHVLGTPYGAPSDAIVAGRIGDATVLFLARHGEGHALAPHEINYRANVWALKELGATAVLAINAVGGISERMAPRVLALADQLIDYTWGRSHTYFEGGETIEHVDMTWPYDRALRARVLAAAADEGIDLLDGGTYGATQGPRLETIAEIRRMARDGCDLVGMTGMPEAGLARELGLAYVCLAVVANWAAGCGDEAEITLAEVLANVAAASRPIPGLIRRLATP